MKKENYNTLKDIMSQLGNQKNAISRAFELGDDELFLKEKETFDGLIDLLLGELDYELDDEKAKLTE